MARVRGDQHTMDLLDWQPPKVAVAPAEDMRGPLDLVIARLITTTLKGGNRKSVAEDMSRYLGRTISKDQLDAWASPGKPSNRMPLDAAVALIAVTGNLGILGWLAGEHGHVVVPARYADLIEMHLLEEKEAEIARRKAALAARYKGGRS